MARIRTIKPEFWKDDKIMDCKPLERLLFIGLWNLSDDYGRMELSPRTIRAELFPEDEIVAADVRDMLMALSSKGLITIYSAEDKEYLAITNWEKHQRIDNKAKPKVPAPFTDIPREEKQILARNSDESEKKSLEREREKEGEKEKERKEEGAVAPRSRIDEKFEEFWKLYPRREGANPKEPAKKQFVQAVKSNADPNEIIAGVKRCREVEAKNINTPYIPQAVKWLRDQRWNDYPEKPEDELGDGKMEVMDQLALEAWDAHGVKTIGKPFPRNKRGGWRFPTKWPPGHAEAQLRGVEDIIAASRGQS